MGGTRTNQITSSHAGQKALCPRKGCFPWPYGYVEILSCEGLIARVNYLVFLPLSFSHTPYPILQKILISRAEYMLKMATTTPDPSLHHLSFRQLLQLPDLPSTVCSSHSSQRDLLKTKIDPGSPRLKTLHIFPSHSESKPKSTPWA